MTDNDDNKTNKSSTDTKQKFDPARRRFLKNTGIAVGGVAGGSLLGGLLTNQFQTESADIREIDAIDFSETRMFFDRESDFQVLSQAVERIYPENDNGPGAIALGVPYFIDKQLASSWGDNAKMYMKKPFQEGESPLNKAEIFLQGVRKINEISQKEYDEIFIDLDEEKQVHILDSFDKDEIKMKNVSSAAFFASLIQMTLEGAYSDPMYGGNKDMKGWAMKEYPGPRMNMKDKVEAEFEVFEKMKRKSLKTHI